MKANNWKSMNARLLNPNRVFSTFDFIPTHKSFRSYEHTSGRTKGVILGHRGEKQNSSCAESQGWLTSSWFSFQ